MQNIQPFKHTVSFSLSSVCNCVKSDFNVEFNLIFKSGLGKPALILNPFLPRYAKVTEFCNNHSLTFFFDWSYD